jgi:hypothetical protein
MGIEVVLISCAMGFGSGVVIAPNTVISAAHVFQNDTCIIDNRSATIVYQDADSDVVILTTDPDRPFQRQMTVSCAPITTNETYRLIGSRARSTVRAIDTRYDVRVAPTQITYNLRGADPSRTPEPGMSGGAVVDEQDRLVGIISATTADGKVGIIELATTPMCQQEPAQ